MGMRVLDLKFGFTYSQCTILDSEIVLWGLVFGVKGSGPMF